MVGHWKPLTSREVLVSLNSVVIQLGIEWDTVIETASEVVRDTAFHDLNLSAILLVCLLLFQKFWVYDRLGLCERNDRQFSLNHLIDVSEKQVLFNLIFIKLFVKLLISFPIQ